MADFKLTSQYKPTGDQPEAIEQLTEGLQRGDRAQVLLGVTGSGKTFTVANVIANVNRPTLILSHNKTLAAGGGCNLALGCDFVFAADNAKFLQAFVGIALIPDTGGGYMLPRAIGTHRAMDMFVTGRPVSAQECFELGLVKEVTTAEELLPKATAFAKKLADGPTLAYANMKKMMFVSMYQDFEKFVKAEVALQNQCAGSADFKEGITAFLEKRKANFTGK